MRTAPGSSAREEAESGESPSVRSAEISSSTSASARSWPAVRASASATPGPSAASSAGSASSLTRTLANRRSALCGSCQGSRPSAAQASAVTGLRSPSSGRQEHAAARRHACQRARTRPAGKPEQHRLRLVVKRVPEQHRGRAVPGRHPGQRRVPRGPRGRLRAARAAVADLDGNGRGRTDQPEAGQHGGDGRRAGGRAFLQPVVDGHRARRAARRAAPRTRARRRAPASPSRQNRRRAPGRRGQGR